MFALAAIGRVEGLLDYNRLHSDISKYDGFSVVVFPEPDNTFTPTACFSRRIGIIRQRIMTHCVWHYTGILSPLRHLL